jgi:hypothetical protein
MAEFIPAIHVFDIPHRKKDVDARVKPWHDGALVKTP